MTNDNNNLIAGGDELYGKVYMAGVNDSSNGLSTGAIVGIVIGGAVFLILVVILIVWLVKRRK